MLQAISLNKAGRNITSDEIHWKKLFRTSEDSLTSTIFGLLLYLPNELFWDILLKSCYGNDIPNYSYRITDYSFWPRWDPLNTRNTNLVEPDLFIKTLDFDIIIEVKRYDQGLQDAEQWISEYKAYLNEFGDFNRDVYLIAVGGINDDKTETIILNEAPYLDKKIKVIKCRWSRLLKTVKDFHYKFDKNQLMLSAHSSVFNILNDLLLGFRIHGFYTGEWFEKTDFGELSGIRDESIHLLEYFNIKNDLLQ
ncbi:hypothetical protein LX99_03328 [Mucilaginibacter oryzae]|uniref:Uncharacterized protein n=1 Tax=Mucilaginibacter oryzae TaxID=468058 RepID=A0A316HNI8_9SPHI|nr:hypothetical protein [Mucilaginibacter oryzae]PWK76462.1 hypothetical protein LX99_03328 [Mucilaginibacter oryzae]